MKSKCFARALCALESLEPRIAPATIVVTSLLDNGDGDNLTLREAIERANTTATADVIVFKPGLTGEIALNGTEIPITTSLKIVGPGASKLSIDAGDQSRIFNIDDDADARRAVAIGGLTLTNGNAGANGAGGGIFTSEALSLSGVVVLNCDSGRQGGGIASYAPLRLSSVTVADCTSAEYGGGVFAWTTGDVSITASTIRNNSGNDGGGLYLIAKVTTLKSTVISGNTATHNAGGLSAAVLPLLGDSAIHVMQCRIVGNTADNDAGGALLSCDHNLVGPVKARAFVVGSTISHNTATEEGGGMMLSGGTMAIDRSEISHNTAKQGGGVQSGVDSLAVKGSTLTSNRATDAAGPGGGGLLLYGDTVLIEKSILSGNTSASDGGGFTLNDGFARVRSTTVSGNTAADHGGGGHARDSGTLTVESSSFFDNRAGSNGGGLHVQADGSSIAHLVVKGSIFRTNYAEEGGGGIDVDDDGAGAASASPISIIDSRFIANTAQTDTGGGLYLRSTGAIVITGGLIAHNAAGDDGGGLAVRGGTPGVKVLGTLLRDNFALGDEGGGVAVFGGGQLILSRTTSILFNSAEVRGGGISNDHTAPVLLNGAKVLGNLAADDPQIRGLFTP